MSVYSEDDVHRSCQIQRWVDKRRQADDAIEAEVKCARTEDMSWAKIGAALGVTAQAAWQHYGLTDRQKREIALAQERRFTQPVLDGVDIVPIATGSKKPRGKRVRSQADR